MSWLTAKKHEMAARTNKSHWNQQHIQTEIHTNSNRHMSLNPLKEA